MSLETALISAVAAVVSGLCFLFRLLWSRSLACEKWREEKEPLINSLASQVGTLSGIMRLVHGCKVEGCSFSGRVELPETLSLRKQPQPPQSKP
jgi:hypothetical protein